MTSDPHAQDHDHDHGHDHAHAHPTRPDGDEQLGHYQIMEIALREILIEKGIITADEVRRMIEVIDARTPSGGAKIIARAWTDPEYKARLLANGAEAARELDIDVGATHLLVVENKPKLHNVIVCTLCSCYPRMVLGRPPDWYKSRAYRSRIVREPRAVLGEFGTNLADDVELRVHDSTADMRYLVLPLRPAGTDGWNEERLAGLITRDSMIGVSQATPPEG